MNYVPLWCRTNYSFLEGASHPDELVQAAVELGLPALAVTDRDGVYGVVRAHVKARELGLKLLLGSELTVDDGTTMTLLATDRGGWASLCRLITKGRLRSDKGQCVVGWAELCEHAEGLIALWGGERSLLASVEGPGAVGLSLKEAFGDRLYAMVTRHRREDEGLSEARLRGRAQDLGLALVAAVEVLYHTLARRPLQDVLTCIRHGVTLHEAGRLTRPNAEHALRPVRGFEALFRDLPDAVERTMEVAARCSFSLDQIEYRYPSEALPDGTTSAQWLRELTYEGARQRYDGAVPVEVGAQLERELEVIDELDYPGYFLTMHHIVEFCRAEQILCQGRGSAANSAVCFCLGITAVDPVRMKLLFERFISRERAEPPDIDLDIEHERREEVIQHVYEAYGRDKAAMVANVIRYRAKSAVREVGKALAIPETSLDRLSKLCGWWTAPDAETLSAAGLDPSSRTHRLLLSLVPEILDFPRHLSIHPGGFLLGHAPVYDLVPIENATMEDRTVIQWDKEDVEALGLFKVDLLGLGALTQLHRTFDLLRDRSGVALSMATIPPDDPETYDMICRAETVGVFQIESRAQMSMLPRLLPRTFYDLVIEVSIVRPGPISGGMVHPFLRRRRGEEEVTYPHPCLEPVLEKTLGVPLFQEQVMKLAVVAADYTPGEADQLRRDMAAWRRSGAIEKHRVRLVSRMMDKGIPEEFAERVFEQIRGFGEYGFPESHAASFALISYATSYLRAHYPAEFLCGLLNAQPMGFYSTATLVHDAKRRGVEVRPLCVSASEWDCTLESVAQGASEGLAGGGAPEGARRRASAPPHTRPEEALPPARSVAAPGATGWAVRMGLRFVKGLGSRERERLEVARREGAFRSLEDLVNRADLGERALTQLAEAGALACFGVERREALWKVTRLARQTPIPLPLDDPQPEVELDPLDVLSTIAWDYRATDHSPRGHLLGPLRAHLAMQRLPPAEELNRLSDGARTRYVGLVICRQRPGTANGVVFMTLEDETGFVNLVVWEQVFERYRVLAKTEPFLGITGRVQAQHGVVHLIADHLWRPTLPLRAERSRSRDFH
jgi:error-prone DNA polymerase